MNAHLRRVGRAALVAGVLAVAPASFAGPPGMDDYEAGMALYVDGRHAEALTFFTKAAHAGHVRSQEIAGLMNLLGPRLYGEEVATDRQAAERWLRLAAANGSEMAVAMARRIAPAPAIAMEPVR